jgi:hypothetical protein
MPYVIKNAAINIGKTIITGRTIGKYKNLRNIEPDCRDFRN